MKRRFYRHPRNLLELLLWQILKPPKVLLLGYILIIVAGIFFEFDLPYWLSKFSELLYFNKVNEVLTSLFDAIITSI